MRRFRKWWFMIAAAMLSTGACSDEYQFVDGKECLVLDEGRDIPDNLYCQVDTP